MSDTNLRGALRDVGSANAVATVVAVEAEELQRKLPKGTLVERLWHQVFMPEGWKTKDLLKRTMPLLTWVAVERNLFRIFGNPQAAAKAVAAKAATADFGGLELADWFRWLLRLFVPPSFVFASIIPRLMPKFNTLKRVTLVEEDDNHVIYRVQYMNKSGKQTHDPHEDMGSRVWFETAMTAGAAKYWFPDAARVVHHVLELDLVQYLQHFTEFMPGTTFYRSGGTLRMRATDARPDVMDTVVATQVQLRPDDDGFYTVVATQEDLNMGFDTRLGWRVERDIAAVDAMGETWQPVASGTIFCAGAKCSLTEYNWRPQTIALRAVFRFAVFCIKLLGGSFTGAARLAEAKTNMAELAAERDNALGDAERERALRQEMDKDHFPTEQIATAMREQAFSPRQLFGALLFFDLGDSTAANERLPNYADLLQQFMDAIDAVMVRYREGAREDGVVGFTVSEPGDARLMIFSRRWNEHHQTMDEAVARD